MGRVYNLKMQFVFRTICAIIIVSVASMFVHQYVSAEDDRDRRVSDMFEDGQQSEEVQGSPSPDVQEQETKSGELSLLEDNNGISDHPLVLILKLVFYTALVIALIYLLVKIVNARQKKMQHHQLFRHLGGMNLGQNKSLQLVKVGGKVYFLGVGEQITLIKEIEDEEQLKMIDKDLEEQHSIRSLPWIERIFTPKDRGTAETQPFQSMFEQSLERQKKRYGHGIENKENEEGRS